MGLGIFVLKCPGQGEVKRIGLWLSEPQWLSFCHMVGGQSLRTGHPHYSTVTHLPAGTSCLALGNFGSWWLLVPPSGPDGSLPLPPWEGLPGIVLPLSHSWYGHTRPQSPTLVFWGIGTGTW